MWDGHCESDIRICKTSIYHIYAEGADPGGGWGLAAGPYAATGLMEPNVYKHKHGVHTKMYFRMCLSPSTTHKHTHTG